MRIGIDIRPLQEDRTSGVQVYIKNLLDSLFALDQKNQYLLFANSAQDFSARLPEFPQSNVEVKYFRYSNKLFGLGQKFLNLPKVDRLLGGLDLFFSPRWRVVALSKDVPLVMTFHDLSFETHPEFFTLRQQLFHKFMNDRRAAEKAAKVVAVSKNTKKDLLKIYKLQESKVEVIYPGVKLSKRLEAPKVSLPNDYFLHLATFEPRKNLQAVLAAFKEYCGLSERPKDLVLAGSKGWKLSDLSIPPELKSKVVVIQDISEAEKSYLYSRAFALLFLSFYEGFGFPIVEAAKAGVPVISSFGTSLSEIGAEFAILVNPLRPSQVARVMLELETDEVLRESLIEKGRRKAEGFSWDKSAKKMLRLFEEVVAEKK